MAFSTRSLFTKPAAGLRWLALAALGALGTHCQPAAPTEQVAPGSASDSLKLETAVAMPMPKFDVESPIMHQLALLPPAERQADPKAMHRYQQLTRRFWLAEYSTEYLLKQAQTPSGPPNVVVFERHLATIQSHWRVLREALSQHPAMPPTMTDHVTRMQQVERYQQAALADMQADCAASRPPHPDATTLATQPAVQKLLAPLLRAPAPLEVRVRPR
ncbi:MAG: hypothetical protein EOO36_05540 [Cytophagaceae bacterium]|nr:MAG: hypothetical protein EOO36_05540 [Cytophagaceae bacterium]